MGVRGAHLGCPAATTQKHTIEVTIAKLNWELIACLMSKTAAKTHNDGLILFYSILDSDALDFLIKALHAVAKARG